MEIADKIKKIRTDNSLSQEQFAEMFHVTRQAVSNWEHGRNYPDMNTLGKISDRFGISFDELIKSDEDFINQIDKTRAKAGLWKKLFLFALGILTVFAFYYVVPKAVKALCYDPAETVAITNLNDYGDTIEENRLTSDLEVFSTLRMPGYKYDSSNIIDLGMGKYNFTASRSAWIGNTKGNSFSGQIERNKLQIYEPDKFELPTSNAFEWNAGSTRDIRESLKENMKKDQIKFSKESDGEIDTSFAQGMGGTTEVSKAILEELNPETYYEAYVSFNNSMPYSEALNWIDKHEDYELINPWVAVSTSEKTQRGPIGFYPFFSGAMRGFDKQKYPYLFGYSDPQDYDGRDELREEPNAKKHLMSMLKYMQDQKRFCRMLADIDLDANFYSYGENGINEIIDYIDKNGIIVYGVAVTAKKEDLVKLHEDRNVFSIGTEVY